MREIKFRAWDRDKNNMLDPGYLSLDGSGLKSYFNEAESLWYHNDIDIILMQYTGLKDKDGVEIYEGDIVRKEWIEFTKEHREQIVDVQWITNGYGAIFYTPEKLEVIGNIYENPELLK